MLKKVLAGRFRITGLLGSGGMGQVWAAEDEWMRRAVAIKIVHPQYGMGGAEALARFQREVQLAARLAHQNLVTVHDWGEVEVDGSQTLFYVMELVQGVPLRQRLEESRPAWPLAVGWAAQIAEALHAAHTQGVVHRDIKPANVLITPDGTVKVLDFGIAKFMGETVGARKLTVTGALLGSPPYMSPEQAEGDPDIDHRSDLYSLGCLLYHAITGQPPFTAGSHWAVLLKHIKDTPKSPSAHVEDLPALLNDLILGLLAKRPENRPADAATVCEALSTLLADHAVTEPGGSILGITQLGGSRSVSGLILKRAWELRAEAERIVAQAEERKAQAIREAKRTVAAVRRELGVLVEHAENLDAELERITGQASAEELQLNEEKYYLVFRQSIKGSWPTPREFGDSVEAVYGISLPGLEAMRMVQRFSDRFTAELEEDHIA
ncbi:protein kinase [Streptomyces collinus]|uniref:serine/threonine-protein kinase n=1 Tax=Streptomyces collinus TaxID=42684 RepID=UPI0036617426